MLPVLRTLCCTIALSGALAADASDLEALAKESKAKCTATAKDKATPEIIIAKVKEGCAVLAKGGDAALNQFRGKVSPFIFRCTYILIYDGDGVMVLQPIKYKLIGKPLGDLRDSKGKAFMVDIMTLTKAGKAGWVDYWWPKPGEKEPSYKVSYVESVTKDGKMYVVACGTNDITEADGAKLVAANPK
jgi:hypothetical protein